MSKFAVVENGVVVNLIVADTKEIAENVTSLECVEYPPTSDIAIGNEFNQEFQWYISPKPHNSWIFNVEKKSWVAPVEKPTGDYHYAWDEDNKQWKEMPSFLL